MPPVTLTGKKKSGSEVEWGSPFIDVETEGHI